MERGKASILNSWIVLLSPGNWVPDPWKIQWLTRKIEESDGWYERMNGQQLTRKIYHQLCIIRYDMRYLPIQNKTTTCSIQHVSSFSLTPCLLSLSCCSNFRNNNRSQLFSIILLALSSWLGLSLWAKTNEKLKALCAYGKIKDLEQSFGRPWCIYVTILCGSL